MPSKHSPASQSTKYESDAAKMLETKNDMTINSLIKGMTDMERIDHWIKTEELHIVNFFNLFSV